MRAWLRKWFHSQSFEEFERQVQGAMEREAWADAARLLSRARDKWPERPEVWLMAGELALAFEAPEEALRWYGRAIELDDSRLEGHIGFAQAAIEACDFPRAHLALQRAEQMAPDDAAALHARATWLELSGRGRQAWTLYQRAAARDPERFFVPARVSRAHFDRLVRQAIRRLPAHVAEAISNLEVGSANYPKPDLVPAGEPPLNPTLLGVFLGATRAEQSIVDGWGPMEPSRIFVFQRNLERVCANPRELAEQVTITIFHEVGHYLGLDEDEVAARGLG